MCPPPLICPCCCCCCTVVAPWDVIFPTWVIVNEGCTLLPVNCAPVDPPPMPPRPTTPPEVTLPPPVPTCPITGVRVIRFPAIRPVLITCVVPPVCGAWTWMIRVAKLVVPPEILTPCPVTKEALTGPVVKVRCCCCCPDISPAP